MVHVVPSNQRALLGQRNAITGTRVQTWRGIASDTRQAAMPPGGRSQCECFCDAFVAQSTRADDTIRKVTKIEHVRFLWVPLCPRWGKIFLGPPLTWTPA